jgi:50S ribosomal protein L16 3-hydroxylase
VDATLAQGVCYVDGERHAFGPACVDAVTAVCDKEKLTAAALRGGLKTPGFVAALTQWVNAGYWYFED